MLTRIAATERSRRRRCRYITPPGHGFLPRETAVHHQVRVWRSASRHPSRPRNHAASGGTSSSGAGFDIAWPTQEHILALVKAALGEAKITPAQLDCIAYTKVSNRPCSVARDRDTQHWCRSFARFEGCSVADASQANQEQHAASVGWYTATVSRAAGVAETAFPLGLRAATGAFNEASDSAGAPRAGSGHGRAPGVVRRGGTDAVADVAGAHCGR